MTTGKPTGNGRRDGRQKILSKVPPIVNTSRVLGITVLGDYLVSEGVEAVLENLHRAGATCVTCNPTVTVEAAEGSGSFQPPHDAGSSPRLFDRPLFGKRSLWVESGISYRPNSDFYRDSPYPARVPNALTEQWGGIIGAFVDVAVASGLKVYFQLGAAQPSGLRDVDRPQLPNGEIPTGRMADTGCLVSEAILAYNRAYVRDLLEAYPKISGFRPDWPEYPCYTLGEIFQDFNPQVAAWADRHGFDFEVIRRDVRCLYDRLHGSLSNADLIDFAGQSRGIFSLLGRLMQHRGIFEWMRLKAAMSVNLIRNWREAIDDAGGTHVELSAHAFMPPYSLLTGFDFTGAAQYCDSVSPKLYTMHWSLMVDFWGRTLLQNNPGLDEHLLVAALTQLMDIVDNTDGAGIDDYGYPLPDEPHPIPNPPQCRKIEQVLTAVGRACAVYPLVHGYGPQDDFERRLQLVADSHADGVWINRYGYLSDDKLSAIERIWK